MCTLDFVGGDLNSKLMLKLLASLENVRQTQKLHSSMLQSISRQLNVGGLGATQLPEGMQFPIETEGHLSSLEEKLMDNSTMKILVSHFTVKWLLKPSYVMCC